MPPAHVLVVCTGNICRSPYIERMLRLGLDGRSVPVTVRSAGTGALAGQPMDERAARELRRYGGDPAGFVARDLTPAMVAEADLVLTATRRHRGLVASMHPRALGYCFTLRDFAELVDGLPAIRAANSGGRAGADSAGGAAGAAAGSAAGSAAGGAGGAGGAAGGGPRHTADDLTATAQEPGERVRAVVAAAAARRGLAPPLPAADADVVDPYRREDEAFALMAAQVNAALPTVLRALVG